MLFADDFVGLSDSEQGLQALIDVIYAYSKKWRFEANVAKCAVVVFRNEKELDGNGLEVTLFCHTLIIILI